MAVDELVTRVVEQFRPVAQAGGITLEHSGPAGLTVWGDHNRLRQLLTNLLANAIAYTPRAGRVLVRFGEDGAVVRLAVSDTGVGIAPEDLPHVFDRFYRADRARARHSAGSGLGLPIAQWIAHAHGGRIAIESHPGRGTTVTVWLPIAEAGAVGQAPRPRVAPSGLTG